MVAYSWSANESGGIASVRFRAVGREHLTSDDTTDAYPKNK